LRWRGFGRIFPALLIRRDHKLRPLLSAGNRRPADTRCRLADKIATASSTIGGRSASELVADAGAAPSTA
jgi:hypothetical protein